MNYEVYIPLSVCFCRVLQKVVGHLGFGVLGLPCPAMHLSVFSCSWDVVRGWVICRMGGFSHGFPVVGWLGVFCVIGWLLVCMISIYPAVSAVVVVLQFK